MSLKRSQSSGKSFGGAGGDSGGKIDRQDLFDELKRLSGTADSFTSVDVALAIGAAEAHVSKALLGLAAEGYLERADAGRYRAVGMAEMSPAEFVKAYRERATKAGLPDTSVETQAAASYTAWQILEAGVRATNGLDDKAIGAWLKANRVDTIQGRLRFDGPTNYGDDLMRIKQVQNGKWVVVWPKESTPPGVTLQVQ